MGLIREAVRGTARSGRAAGMRYAVEELFADRPEVPLALPTGQAFLTRLPTGEA